MVFFGRGLRAERVNRQHVGVCMSCGDCYPEAAYYVKRPGGGGFYVCNKPSCLDFVAVVVSNTRGQSQD